MTPNRPAPALDDRSQPVAILRPHDVRATAQCPDPHRAALARHLSNAINAEARRWTPRAIWLGLALVVAYILLQVFVSLAGLTRYPMLIPVFRIGGLIAVVIVSRADTRRHIASHLAATAVAEGLCGGCCYSLRDLPADVDGCIVCPECGAAWQARRITRPHWLRAESQRTSTDGGSPISGWLVRFFTLTPPPGQLIAPDDRGRFVCVVDSRLLLVPRARREQLGSARLAEVRSGLRAVGRELRVLFALAPAIVAVLLGIASLNAAAERDAGLSLGTGVGLAMFASLAVGLVLSHAFYSPRRAARIMVARSLCPSCVHPLDGLPADADGCAVCPGCGSSWRPPTIDR